MAADMNKVAFLIVFVFFCLSCHATKRKVTNTLWPNCDKFTESCEKAQESGFNVVYSKASAPKFDTLHYVFSTIGLPTLMLAHTTGADVNLNFNWDKLLNESTIEDAITVEGKGKVQYKFAVAFTKLIEYDDKHDSADIEESEKKGDVDFKSRDFGQFLWMNVTEDKKMKNTFVFNTTSDGFEPLQSHNGSLSFALTVREDEGRAKELPSLKYGANETQFDFVLANYTPSFNHSRFALEAVLISSSAAKNMNVKSTDSIDDEYSPGVFEIIDWLSNPEKEATAGFLQWKPVCYIAKYRERKSATKVKHYDLLDLKSRKNETDQLKKTVIAALFGKTLWDEKTVIMRTTNISFGLAKDGFYLKNNYTAWSAAMGYGTPPADSISTTVIIIISAGLGLPVVIIIVGGIYSIIRKMRRGSSYQPITGSINRTDPQVN